MPIASVQPRKTRCFKLRHLSRLAICRWTNGTPVCTRCFGCAANQRARSRFVVGDDDDMKIFVVTGRRARSECEGRAWQGRSLSTNIHASYGDFRLRESRRSEQRRCR
ncbi:hypothetical protein QQF64_024283 [Cirrhinus molitorella]|uniref:Uncharacterized protein n=1 Tax=Cirrhinus molitorella TaxID=172907 RepID=A0ABR3NL30_9TELE